MVVFTIQIFAIGIKICGMSCKPDCLHIKKNVNQGAAELNHSLLRSVKICDKNHKGLWVIFVPFISLLTQRRNMLCIGLFKHRTAELYGVSF